MSIIGWVVMGALAGWVASLITGTNQRQGCITDIIVGVVGALLGGFLVGSEAMRSADPLHQLLLDTAAPPRLQKARRGCVGWLPTDPFPEDDANRNGR